MEEFLIVDGYNIIGDWPDLRTLKEQGRLEEARNRLIDWLSEYKAYSGRHVIVVFDAHQVTGLGKKCGSNKLEIYYTKENETADELIERLVRSLFRRKRQIYVATSDYTEQKVIFGQGALRISARELAIEKDVTNQNISNDVKKQNSVKAKSSIVLSLDEEKLKILEKWRRKK